MVVRPPTGGHYLQHRFVRLLLLEMFYELLPFFFMPNQVFVEHDMANATCFSDINIHHEIALPQRQQKHRNLQHPEIGHFFLLLKKIKRFCRSNRKQLWGFPLIY